MDLSHDTNICMSGGAEGADLEWGAVAAKAGHRVIHWSFAGHRTRVPRDQVVVLTEGQLREADAHLIRANWTFCRRFPPASAYALNLLRRDWFQAAQAESLYAVASFDSAGRVVGGTAWAIQMFLDERPSHLPVYLFDQDKGGWLVWRHGWHTAPNVPLPRGIWAGIGSRALNEQGSAAICALMGYPTPPR